MTTELEAMVAARALTRLETALRYFPWYAWASDDHRYWQAWHRASFGAVVGSGAMAKRMRCMRNNADL